MRKEKNLKFYGPFYKSTIFLGRIFTKRYKCLVEKPTEACVYVSRHLNMHGPFTLVKSLNFHTHLFVLNVFFDRKESYKQFSEYTFSKRAGMSKGWSKFCALCASSYVSSLIKSSKAIPVYRNNAGAYATLKIAFNYLKKGETVTLFPDIDYTADKNKESEIYKGFIFLEKMYYKATNKHLKFIPILIDDDKRVIYEKSAIMFDDTSDFHSQMEEIATKIKQSLY